MIFEIIGRVGWICYGIGFVVLWWWAVRSFYRWWGTGWAIVAFCCPVVIIILPLVHMKHETSSRALITLWLATCVGFAIGIAFSR